MFHFDWEGFAPLSQIPHITCYCFFSHFFSADHTGQNESEGEVSPSGSEGECVFLSPQNEFLI